MKRGRGNLGDDVERGGIETASCEGGEFLDSKRGGHVHLNGDIVTRTVFSPAV